MTDFLPLLAKAFPPASETSLEAIEARIGVKLPDEYRAFLLQSNGGSFARHIVVLPDGGGRTVLNYMLGTAGGSYDIMTDYDDLRSMDRIPVASLPIADDPGGNLFIVSLEQQTYGSIYFWDHEQEPSDGGSTIAEFPNMAWLAPGFGAFIAALKDDSDG